MLQLHQTQPSAGWWGHPQAGGQSSQEGNEEWVASDSSVKGAREWHLPSGRKWARGALELWGMSRLLWASVTHREGIQGMHGIPGWRMLFSCGSSWDLQASYLLPTHALKKNRLTGICTHTVYPEPLLPIQRKDRVETDDTGGEKTPGRGPFLSPSLWWSRSPRIT